MTTTQNENGNGSTRSRVLLVEDDYSVRDLLYRLLDGDGYEVLAASDGIEGLNMWHQSTHPIELLVTDYDMPHMSGVELARECTRHRSELKVLYVSGGSPDEHLLEDLKAPRRSFLAKPFHASELLCKARELLLAASVGQSSSEPQPV